MKFGASQELARWIRMPERFYAVCGNGGRAEAEMADRPPFHILHNHQLLSAAVTSCQDVCLITNSFRIAAGKLSAKQRKLRWNRRNRNGPSCAVARVLDRLLTMRKCAEKLRERRDKSAEQLGLEQSFVASRGALEAIAADPVRAKDLLAPWQHELLGIDG